MHPDPHQRRRQRQEKRAKREALQRKLKIGGAAILALALVGLLVFLLLPKGGTPDAPSSTGTPSPVPSGSDAPSAPTAENTVIHFAATGDLNITDKIIASGKEDFSDIFRDVAPLLSAADLTTVNLEGNIAGAPYGTASGSAPHALVQALQRCGVDMIQLANSFSINRGPSGLSSTIDAVRSAGLEPVGAFKNEQEYASSRGFSLFEVKGIKIAVVGFTKGLGGMSLSDVSENCVNLLYTDYDSTYQKINKKKINAIFDQIDLEQPDLVIALVHWGSVFNDNISSTQKSIVKLLQSRGADAIIGTHPHYVQKMTFDEQTGQFVAYSLGDFVSDADEAGTEYSVLLDLEITKNGETGETKITNYSYVPLFTVATEESVQVVRLTEAMQAYTDGHLHAVSEAVYDDMVYALKRIKARVKG